MVGVLPLHSAWSRWGRICWPRWRPFGSGSPGSAVSRRERRGRRAHVPGSRHRRARHRRRTPRPGRRMLPHVFDEAEFLSPYGLRALSKYHAEHPFRVELPGQHLRGLRARRVPHRHVRRQLQLARPGVDAGQLSPRAQPPALPQSLGSEAEFEYPTGSGENLVLAACADDLRGRLVSLFLRGPDGRRPCHGWVDKLQNDPRWRDNITFHEYFHGDNGAGLGAAHQTGWTGLRRRPDRRPDPFAGGARPWQL